MVSIPTNQFSNGITLRINGELYDLVFFEFVKPGKGAAFVRTKLRSLKTGNQKELTFDSKDKVEQVIIDKRDMEYLYRDGEHYVFMDPTTFDQVLVDAELVKPMLKYLKENTVCKVEFYEGSAIAVEVPFTVELKVVKTEPSLKGATITNVYKPATLETGAVVQVPPFIEEGEVIRVDTREAKYLERANK